MSLKKFLRQHKCTSDHWIGLLMTENQTGKWINKIAFNKSWVFFLQLFKFRWYNLLWNLCISYISLKPRICMHVEKMEWRRLNHVWNQFQELAREAGNQAVRENLLVGYFENKYLILINAVKKFKLLLNFRLSSPILYLYFKLYATCLLTPFTIYAQFVVHFSLNLFAMIA